jgi:hypothetical protein
VTINILGDKYVVGITFLPLQQQLPIDVSIVVSLTLISKKAVNFELVEFGFSELLSLGQTIGVISTMIMSISRERRNRKTEFTCKRS